MPPEVLVPPSRRDIRAELETLVLRELLGPAGGPDEEVDESHVTERYLVGMLAPRKQQDVPLEDQDELGQESGSYTEDGPNEPNAPAPVRTTLFPSSFGLTFSIDKASVGLTVVIRWGWYRRADSALLKTESGRPRKVWKRTPVEATVALPLKAGPVRDRSLSSDQERVFLRGRMRDHGSAWVVTLFLVNGQDEPERSRDEAWLFQPEIVVEDAEQRPTFRVRQPASEASDDEDAAMRMLYRRRVEFAVGHGVSIHAESTPDDPTRAVRVMTRVIPAHEVPRVERPRLGDVVLDMAALAETADFDAALQPLVNAYDRWVADRREHLTDPDLQDHVTAATQALQACTGALDRIRDGLQTLRTDPHAANAFRFMNRVMALQRIRTLYASAVRRGERIEPKSFDEPTRRSWYPFQLAFILLNLPALTDLAHPDRATDASAIADLLWFPTGGGKTEAYLGLAAYTFAIRRLQGTVAGRNGEHGTAVLMRYTLRLLTLQQFQRAAALVCAAETVRRDDPRRWGETPFRLGLWVGQRTTPNTTEDSDEAIRRSHDPTRTGWGTGSPAQLTHCPWCGLPIDRGKNIRVEKPAQGRGRTYLFCSDALGRCPFSEAQGEGIPVLVVDDEIYRHPPAMLIATVDKFAQMPWRSEVQLLFGNADSRCERHGFKSPDSTDAASHPAKGSLPRASTASHPPLRPPDLIIQDELHLISGPLGSLVGLYETAVDALATWQVGDREVRPKVVASTATIKRASDQIHALFLRQIRVFPPHGLDVEDNFFSREPSLDESPGRRYLGICAPGRRLKEVLIRVYVAHLAAAQTLLDRYRDPVLVDPYMTLVGYFNALRELGGMNRLVLDDVRSRLQHMDRRGLSRRFIAPEGVEELTSRKTSNDIPRLLDRLESPVPAPGEKKSKFLDVLLATNMISVGVDVGRLGLMVSAGQPKNTAEYIQATSRVGRNCPGLVCTVYNWARPRDLSVYERFEHYHATFYRSVEPLSVTPFAPRALDRALSGVLVAMVRLLGREFSRNDGAEAVKREHSHVERTVAALARRARCVTGSEAVETLVRAELDARLERWVAEAAQGGGRRLGYKQQADGVTVGLLRTPGPTPWDTFTCLNSLREVEPTTHLILDDHGLDDVAHPEVEA